MNQITIENLTGKNGETWGRKSFGVINVDVEPDTACVFIHGWGGGPSDTWFGFPTRLRSVTKPVDFFFYGYESYRKSASISAERFRKFLYAVSDDPLGGILLPSMSKVSLKTPLRNNGFHYKKIVLCCHSLGAVVARRALIDMEAEHPGSIAKTEFRMLLFAPAHCGSYLVEIAQEFCTFDVLRLPLAVIGKIVLVQLKSMRDLEPNSAVLQALASDNAALCARISGATHKPPSFLPRTFHGDKDLVVESSPFLGDPPIKTVVNHGHKSICKPTDSYLLPLTELLGML